MLLWPPAVFLPVPPLSAGGEASKVDTPVNPPLVKQAAVRNLVDEINSADPVVHPEDAKVKRTDIKKIMGAKVITKINGNPAICDLCGDPATNFWVDCDAGCAWARCDKHK